MEPETQDADITVQPETAAPTVETISEENGESEEKPDIEMATRDEATADTSISAVGATANE